MKCFNCNQDGHVASQCSWQTELADPAGRETAWCGTCDPRTRQLIAGDSMARCPECHPLRHQMLAHHKRCPHCRKITVAWDTAQDCEHHILAGITRPHTPVQRKTSRLLTEEDMRDLAKQQVAESRTARPELAAPFPDPFPHPLDTPPQVGVCWRHDTHRAGTPAIRRRA